MTLAIENLSFTYGRLSALTDVSTNVRPGALTAIIGPNAAGKSTLLRCMIGVHKPANGCVRLDGAPVHELRPHALAGRMAYVAQRASLSASFTVREVVELGRFALTRDERRIDTALRQLDLIELEHRVFQTLSVGQQQRVMLARALAQIERGGYLLLDEPTAAMDLHHVAQTARLLRSLREQSISVIAALHDLNLAGELADDVWILDGGRLIAGGAAMDVMTHERLAQVFRVRFDVCERFGGQPALLPRLLEQ